MTIKRFLNITITALLFTKLVLAYDLSARSDTPAASFDVIEYAAEIEPDLANKSIKGKVTIRFRLLADGPREIHLNAGVLEIDEVKEGKRSLRYEKKGELLTISLDRAARKNDMRSITIGYHGTPRSGIKFFPEQRQLYTLFSTSQWMPCVDAPSDRSAFRLTLITPKDMKVAGNGRLAKQSPMPGDRISTVWVQDDPIPTYIFGFAAGQFREVTELRNGIELRYLASPQFSAGEVKQIFKDSADMLDFYKSKAGVKYPGRQYTQILAAGGAQQEMSGFAVMNDDYGRGVLANEGEIWLAAHEISHQWWGNMVTNRDWNHFWLNEGMATFMVAAYKEHRFGREEYLAEIGKLRARYERVRDAGKDKPLVFPDWNNPSREDRSIVYNKGGYVLHLLREEMGDQPFWKGIRNYTSTFWGRSVTTRDFQEAMQKASTKDLSTFFTSWVYSST